MRIPNKVHKKSWISVDRRHNVVEFLSRLLSVYKKGQGVPSVHILRDAFEEEGYLVPFEYRKEGTPQEHAEKRQKAVFMDTWSGKVRVGRFFLELCRLREFAEGLRVRCRRLEMEPSKATVMLYLLTGHLRPANEPLLTEFLASADFNEVASVVYNIEGLGSIKRFYYKYLLRKNLFSTDIVNKWAEMNDISSAYTTSFLEKIKTEAADKGFSCPVIRSKKAKIPSKSTLSRTTMSKGGDSTYWEKLHRPKPMDEQPRVEKGGKLSPRSRPTKQTTRCHPSKSRPSVYTYPEWKANRESEEDSELKLPTSLDKFDGVKLVIDKKEYTEKTRLFKTRTNMKNTESQIPRTKKGISDFRTNAATLLKEAAVILKEEEEENMKLLALLHGSPNYLAYEKMIEDRMREEQELFNLKIEKLHMKGKLTEQAAIMAKQRLQYESRERRREFEEERRQFLEDMSRLREIEREKVARLVEKVKRVQEKVATQKQKIIVEKRQEVEKVTNEIRESVRQAIEQKKIELQQRVMMIKEYRVFQAFRKSLQQSELSKKREKCLQESSNIGLLCEMSLEELEKRKELMKITIEKERVERRNLILTGIKAKEDLLDEVEHFIMDSRNRKRFLRKNKLQKIRKKIPELSETTIDIIPKTFLRPVPVMYENEAIGKEVVNEINESKKDKRNRLQRNKIMQSKKHMKEDLILDKDMGRMFEKGSTHLEKKSKLMTLSIKVHVTKKRCGSTETNRFGSRQTLISTADIDYKTLIIWRKFKKYMSQNAYPKLPFYIRILKMPPRKWHKKKIQKEGKKKRISKAMGKKKLVSRRMFFGKKYGIRRSLKFRTKWMQRWQKFYKTWIEMEEVKKGRMQMLEHDYTKNIIKQVQYYYSLVKSDEVNDKKNINRIVEENRKEIMGLKAQLEIIAYKIRKYKSHYDKGEIKKGKRYYKAVPPRRQIIFPDSDKLKETVEEINKYENRVTTMPLLEADYQEIKETTIQPPFDTLVQTKQWLTEDDYKEYITKQRKIYEDSPVGDEPKKCLATVVREIRRMSLKKKIKPKRAFRDLKMVSRYKDKYTLATNKYGNPIFFLKPMKKNPMKWEWLPLLVQYPCSPSVKVLRKLPISFDVEFRGPLVSSTLMRSVIDDYIEKTKHNWKSGFLMKLLTLRVAHPPYLPQLKGEERKEYFRTVPFSILLEYIKSYPFGGDPSKRPPPVPKMK